jgi:predicted DNA-binding transcriptional regulator AlpA
LPPGLSPRGLKLEQAAAFVGLSKPAFYSWYGQVPDMTRR